MAQILFLARVGRSRRGILPGRREAGRLMRIGYIDDLLIHFPH
ncbi:hypothetical protein [Pseudoxanthomonas sp. Soil82]